MWMHKNEDYITLAADAFQLEGPTVENARRCIIEVVALGTRSWFVAEERRTRRPVI